MNKDSISWLLIEFAASVFGSVVGFTLTTYLLNLYDRRKE
jgi:hypothetical protein